MKGVYPEKLPIWKRIIFYLGWLSVFNILFWIVILLVNKLRAEKKFLNPYSRQILYIFGWLIFIVGSACILGNLFGGNDTSSSSNLNIQKSDYVFDYVFEMTTEQIFNEFRELSNIQIEEKLKEFKGSRIKTSIYVSRLDKVPLSSQYVAMEMYEYPYSLSPYAKAFFPAEEKDNLLKVNIGDTIIFSGEFVNYHKGSYIEFTKSKLIEVKKDE